MNEESIKSLLRQLGVQPSKERGQNFLFDSAAIQAIIDFGKPKSEDNLIEIGPGLGALSAELQAVSELTVIELEKNFCAHLARAFPKIRIINQDVRLVEFRELGSELVVFGNLPYSFSTEICFHLLYSGDVLKRAILLLQREFAERLAAEPGGRDYGSLSVAARQWATAYLGPVISGSSFYPATKVESRLVELVFLGKPRVELKDSFLFQQVLRAAFFRRRKKILNSMQASKLFDSEKLVEAFHSASLDSDRRAETFSLEEFAGLADRLFELTKSE